MRIYSRTGDKGTTGLIGGDRIAKASLRIEAIGSIDELNAWIGLVRLHAKGHPLDRMLEDMQSRLFDLGGELASPDGSFQAISPTHTEHLEVEIDRLSDELEPLRVFILPGGSALGAHLHAARTVCRRAERCVLALDAESPVRDEAKAFINRLSDWLFVAARTANASQNVPDIAWRRQDEP